MDSSVAPERFVGPKSMWRLGLILSVGHVVLVIAVFLLFGLGLEGGRRGTWILPLLLQPMRSIVGDSTTPLGMQAPFLALNSMLWGFSAAALLRALRRRRTGS